jgi:hypothetical protein
MAPHGHGMGMATGSAATARDSPIVGRPRQAVEEMDRLFVGSIASFLDANKTSSAS